MDLFSLGQLKLGESDFRREKTLLLISYLALEGEQERRYLAELFWPRKENQLGNLSITVSRFNKLFPEILDIQQKTLDVKIKTDTNAFEMTFEVGHYGQALTLYRGPFADKLQLVDTSSELENWVYGKREFFAHKARAAILELAKSEAYQGNYDLAAKKAEQAYFLRYAPEPDNKTLELMDLMLATADHPLLGELRREAKTFDLTLADDHQKARRKLTQLTKVISVPTNIADLSNPFVGRKKEISELVILLQEIDYRLISIVGFGGDGKTRLSKEIARVKACQDKFTDGIFFVSLDSVNDSMSIPYKIAEALNFNFLAQAEPIEQLIDYLTDKRVLLILDNFEHLLDGVGLCELLLQRCPYIKLLVTSRERLQLENEWVYPLEGLLISSGTQNDAVELFCSCAKRINLTFVLSDNNKKVIGSLCDLIAGSPLAIELAASWTKLLTPEELLQDIQSNTNTYVLQALSKTKRTRHESVKMTFEYSWKMLNVNEQEVLKNLSVLIGHFDLEAAIQVADANLFKLASLADKSLLKVESQGWYTLHPIVRQYAFEKLNELSEDSEILLTKHSQYYCNMLAEQQMVLLGLEDSVVKVMDKANLEITWDDRVKESTKNYDNVLKAWKRLIATKPQKDFYLVANGLEVVFQYLGDRNQFAYELFREASIQLQGLSDIHTPSYASLLIIQSCFLYHLGRTEEAHLLVNQSLELFSFEDKKHLAYISVLSAQVDIHFDLGEYKASRDLSLQVLEKTKALRLPFEEAEHLKHLGTIEGFFGKYKKASTYFEAALVIHRKFGLRFAEALILIHLGSLWIDQEDFEKAKPVLEEALTILTESNYVHPIPYTLDCLARIAIEEEKLEAARALCSEGLERARALDIRHEESHLLITLGRIVAQYDQEEAEALLLQALYIPWSNQNRRMQCMVLLYLAEIKTKNNKQEVFLWLCQIKQENTVDWWIKEKALAILSEFDQTDLCQSEKTLALGTRTIEDITKELLGVKV